MNFPRHTLELDNNVMQRFSFRLTWASGLTVCVLFGLLSHAAMRAQTVNGFRKPLNPYMNTYTGGSAGLPAARTSSAMSGRTSGRSSPFTYRPPAQKPFSNVARYNRPRVTSEDVARIEIRRTLSMGGW